MLGVAACASSGPNYPLTRNAVKFDAMDENQANVAPSVAQTLTGARIASASEPQNWLTYYGTYDGKRYSALDQINRDNVKQLKPAWVFQYAQLGVLANPVTYAFEAAPIVVDGVMYVSGPNGYVWALDAATGRKLWTYQHQIPIDVPFCCGNVNRGVAVAQGKVIFGTGNGVLVALDATNGQPVWQTPYVDPRAGESVTVAPLIVKNLVIVGASGAEYGVRGHVDAFDVSTGKRVWRRYTVPKPGEPGAETWPADAGGKRGGAWARGGGSTWITGTYDPDLDLVYWGTANPSPVFNGDSRSGTNLYTSSVIALDPDDGSIRWHYQWTPHDVWDYDGIGESILFDQDGRKLLAHFDRNGYLFILDRTNGKLVHASRYARADWADIDATSGAVTNRKEPTPAGQRICPGPAGAKVWNHASYSPRANLLYVPVIELCATFKSSTEEFKEGLPTLSSTFQNSDEQGWGNVKAFDPRTGQEVWSWKSKAPIVTSMLSTAGDLVFTGEPTGEFDAFDARSGTLLWQF
ncbi:MAG TPA: PQQ-dependent dehydrogenase, methanol/ethanol family, partial [Gemmatimonadaceae bacterium]|nr:PQQ-dependent dehydrogenase, methanol/ethanol family [Gemmatimonadaceae bacterium]